MKKRESRAPMSDSSLENASLSQSEFNGLLALLSDYRPVLELADVYGSLSHDKA